MKVLVLAEADHLRVLRSSREAIQLFANWAREHRHEDVLVTDTRCECTVCNESVEWHDLEDAPTASITFSDFLDRIGAEEKDSDAIASLIQNMYVFVDDARVQTSGFRGNSADLIEYFGGSRSDYMRYYMPSASESELQVVRRKFNDANVELWDM